jgi:hypothetical protein
VHKGLAVPYVSLLLRVLHTKNAGAFFAQTHAALAECKLCFRRLKKDGEKQRDFYGKSDLLL